MKYITKATQPMTTYDGPGCNRAHATEVELRDSQAAEWVGQYVAFDHDGQRVAGKCINCRSVPRMEPDEIPDFVVVVESLKTAGKNLTVRLVGQRCQFYERREDLKL